MNAAALIAILRARGVSITLDDAGKVRGRGWRKLLPHEQAQVSELKEAIRELLGESERLVTPRAGNSQTPPEPGPVREIVGQRRQLDGSWIPVFRPSGAHV